MDGEKDLELIRKALLAFILRVSEGTFSGRVSAEELAILPQIVQIYALNFPD